MEEKQLTEKQLELLRKSNKTLAIMGLFRSGDEQVRYVVKRSGSQGGTISPMANFFNEVKPELRCFTEGILKVGDKEFYKYNLKTPLEPDNTGYSQAILFDSPLLEGSGYLENEAKKIQEQGKTVVKKLIEKLDHIAYFTHSNFSKSLLKIAKEYLYITVNLKEDEHLISVAQWRNTFNSDHTLCSKILQYLTAYEPDEPEIETDIRQYLNGIKKENSDVSVYTNKQIKKLVEALVQCKTVMRKGDEKDVTWRKITELKEFSWLEDYRSHSIYGLRHPGLGKNSFLAHYQSFIEASDEIHRLVRTQAIHPSIFCWLASKYYEWDGSTETITGAAGEMLEIGIKKQGDKRIRSETYEEQSKNRQIIKEAKVDDEQFNEIEGDENYKQFAERNEDKIFEVLLPERSFGRKALLKRAKELFTFLSQMAGGKAGEVFQENNKFNHLFVKYYRKIFNTESNQIEDFQKELGNLAKKDREAREFQFNIEGFIEKVIEKAKQSETTEDVDLKTEVKETFIREFARESKTRFARGYSENKNEIESDPQLAEDLYGLRSGTEVSSQNEKAGSPAIVLTELAMPDFDKVGKEVKKTHKEKLKKEFIESANGRGKKSVSFARTETVENIDDGSYPVLLNGEEKGKVEFRTDKDIELMLYDPSEANALNHQDAELETQDDRYKLVDLDIPWEEFSSEEVRQIREIVEKDEFKYEQLSEIQDSILHKYSNKNEQDPKLNRGLRALLLSEYILAAPEEATPLGREDLSNILGLMVDIIEHLGDLKNDKILDGVLLEDVKLKELLQKINLSQYYPVTDNEKDAKDELLEIIQYQLELCRQLNNVENYLKEIAELRDFLEAVKGTDLEIVVLNTTLGNYGDLNNIQEDFSPCHDSPSVIYLTGQAEVNPTTFKTIATTLQSLVTDSDFDKLQFPIFLTSEALPEKLGVPVISSDQIVDFSKLQLLFANDRKYNSCLCLTAAALLPRSSDNFGFIPRLGFVEKQDVKQKFEINLSNNQTVIEVLHEIWLSQKLKLIDTFIFTKWLNVMLLQRDSSFPKSWEKFQEGRGTQDKSFGLVLENCWNDNQDDIQSIALGVFKDAISNQFSDLRVKVENSGTFNIPSSFNMSISMTQNFGITDKKNQPYKFRLPWSSWQNIEAE